MPPKSVIAKGHVSRPRSAALAVPGHLPAGVVDFISPFRDCKCLKCWRGNEQCLRTPGCVGSVASLTEQLRGLAPTNGPSTLAGCPVCCVCHICNLRAQIFIHAEDAARTVDAFVRDGSSAAPDALLDAVASIFVAVMPYRHKDREALPSRMRSLFGADIANAAFLRISTIRPAVGRSQSSAASAGTAAVSASAAASSTSVIIADAYDMGTDDTSDSGFAEDVAVADNDCFPATRSGIGAAMAWAMHQHNYPVLRVRHALPRVTYVVPDVVLKVAVDSASASADVSATSITTSAAEASSATLNNPSAAHAEVRVRVCFHRCCMCFGCCRYSTSYAFMCAPFKRSLQADAFQIIHSIQCQGTTISVCSCRPAVSSLLLDALLLTTHTARGESL